MWVSVVLGGGGSGRLDGDVGPVDDGATGATGVFHGGRFEIVVLPFYEERIPPKLGEQAGR